MENVTEKSKTDGGVRKRWYCRATTGKGPAPNRTTPTPRYKGCTRSHKPCSADGSAQRTQLVQDDDEQVDVGAGEQGQIRGQFAVELLIEGDAEVALPRQQQQGEGANVDQAHLGIAEQGAT